MVEDVSPKQAWEALLADPDAQLVDVRTDAEWRHVGLPDLSGAGKQAALVSWQYPSGDINPRFVGDLLEVGLSPNAKTYFLCRSGVRSLAAAHAAEAAGFSACFNVEHGFEGHRGTASGWRADGLPCLP